MTPPDHTTGRTPGNRAPDRDQVTDGASRSDGPPQVAPVSIALPKGGGAIRDMGEKFAVSPATGTGGLAIPIPVTPGRSGLGPALTLSYDSGAGNGPFGLGWSLSLASITRKTDKGLPRYQDADSDVYMLSGVEDLVPGGTTTVSGHVVRRYRPRIEGLFARIERWTDLATGDVHWRSISADNVTTVYGRDENSRIADPADPSRVFSWLICESHDDKGNAVVYTYAHENSDGVDRTLASERHRERGANRYIKRIRYGNRVSRLLQPDLSQASWLFEVVFDYDEGHYERLAPDPDLPVTAQHRYARASASAIRPWAVRPDPFSSHRAGFELRTYRRCRRILMFHHVPDLPTGEPGYDGLVRAVEFDYDDLDYGGPVTVDDELAHEGSTRTASFIRRITQSGHVREETRPDTHLERSMPPLELEYSRAVVQDRARDVDAEARETLPVGGRQWIDLYGEGVPGILIEQGGGWFYRRNHSPLLEDQAAGLGPARIVGSRPNLSLAGRAEFMDLAGDGLLDLVTLDDPVPGVFESDGAGGWQQLRPFTSRLHRDTGDPNLRLVDLTGDGLADVLITQDDNLVWHPSLAEAGFGPAARVARALDEENGPRLVLADALGSVHLADMCGDGLSDLVRVRNGEVCYWPNLGYGRFGAKVTMDDAPWFAEPDEFDHGRVLLADIDGSGTTDLIYLHRDGVRLYFNQSGNRLSGPRRLRALPPASDGAFVTTVDLLGNGTACLVWSSGMPGDALRPMRYVDLMGGTKPHLLTRVVNNLGAETRVSYAASTKFRLADERAGRPWLSRLPFPVHVVARVETFDHVSRHRFVTRYAYHHGHFDGVEREFRGFGLVDQWDTEHLADLEAGAAVPADGNIDASSYVPPVLTRTWFHTGRVADPVGKGEYYREPGLTDEQAWALLLDDTVLPGGLSAADERDACRALKGSVLRQEVYGLDGTGTPDHPYGHPYMVTEQNFTVHRLQAGEGGRPGVFLTHAGESIGYHYERDPADPRVEHTLTLAVDDFGNVLKSASVGYGRRAPDPDLPAADRVRQGRILITYTENDVTNEVDAADDRRAPRPCESRTYELTGLLLPAGRARFTLAEIRDAAAAALPLDYTLAPTPGRREKRLIERVRTYYRRDDLTGPLPLGQVESRALPFESYRLAFTAALVTALYGDKVTDAMLESDGRYVHSEGDADWWVPTGRSFYSPDPADSPAQELAHALRHYFLPHRTRDPFHTGATSTESVVTYDHYDLLPEETRDALGNRVTAGERHPDPAMPLVRRAHDYRVLQPALVMDPNRNRAACVFDAFGMVAGTAMMGKPEEVPVPGDRLTAAFRADLTQAEIDAFFADPRGPAAVSLLDDASARFVADPTAYWREPDPARRPPAPVAAVVRERHADQAGPAGGPRIQVSLAYSDGFGRQVQQKIQAEPGPGPRRDAAGRIIPGPDGRPLPTAEDVDPRWVGSGWTIFNNKGQPVREFEPFFTDTHRYEADVRVGVGSVLFYDPMGRVVATLHPDHTWEKVTFDPWRQESWGVNDTVVVADPATDPDVGDHFGRLPKADYLPTWHALRTDPAHAAAFAARYPDPDDRAAESRAAGNTEVHAATPTITHADSLGRTIVTVVHNRFKYTAEPPVEEFQRTSVLLDIEGNQREVTDAANRVITRSDQDMLGNPVHEAGMESGERWMLLDVAGKHRYTWDGRGHRFRLTYDALQRRTDTFLGSGDGDAEALVERSVYGESRPDPQARNLLGKLVERLDQAGVVTSDDYDFKGNPLRGRRRLARDYKNTLDWSAAPALESESFTSRTAYDALNRPIQLVVPHSDRPGTTVNVVQPVYNEANLLEQMHAWLELATEPSGMLDPATAGLHAVTDIDYDAHGRRVLIGYGNGVETRYSYDPLTFRLTQVITRRPAAAFPGDCPDPAPEPWPGCQVQNLHYAYDPAGNITGIRDEAQQTVFFRNRRVEPSSEYVYDATYRLIEATGREHLGQTAVPIPHSFDDAARTRLPHPGDGNAMGRYVERYAYDVVGNMLAMRHHGSDPVNAGWTRTFDYAETSLLDAANTSNRLTGTTVDGVTETYSVAGDGYDAHGNLLRLPHLPVLEWDEEDRLRMTDRQGERTYYVYDSAGQRVRKVTERADGEIKNERIYLETAEIHRAYGASPVERETLHIMDDERRIVLVETRVSGTEPGVPRQRIRFQFGNHLGSAALELDEQAQIISYEEYAPYGSTTYQAVRGQTEVAKRYRGTGKERDEETGFYYQGARYYAPWLARWIGCDPAGLADGPCLYAYCGGNPVTLHDPSGYQGEPPLPGLVGNDAKVGKLWEQAVVEELGPKFKQDTYQGVVKAFQEELAKRTAAKGLGSNRQKGTGINYARDTYAKVRNRFGKLAEKAGISLQGIQVHHTFDELAKNPAGALDTSNLSFQKGHAGTKGSGHNYAHEVNNAHAAGVKNPGPHVREKLQAEGIHLDVPELGPFTHATPHVTPHATPHVPHVPHTPHTPHVPHAPKGKVGGWIGLAIGVGVAGYVLFDTGDAYAAAQTLNPAANTTDTIVNGEATAGNIAWSAAKDVYYYSPIGTIDSIVFGLMGPQGDYIYDSKLADKAIKEGRNPFCAQCHGPGGALDPNNEWNQRARTGAAFSVIPESRPLTQSDLQVLKDWLR